LDIESVFSDLHIKAPGLHSIKRTLSTPQERWDDIKNQAEKMQIKFTFLSEIMHILTQVGEAFEVS